MAEGSGSEKKSANSIAECMLYLNLCLTYSLSLPELAAQAGIDRLVLH